jgi:deoxyribonuclease-4
VLIPRARISQSVIRVGPAGYPEGSKGPRDAVERAAGRGFSALEVQFVRQAQMSEEKAQEAGARAKQLDVLLSAHAPYYINFNSADRETVEKSHDWVMRTARIAHRLGAVIIVVHAAAYAGRSAEEATAAVVAGVQRCRSAMDEEGVGDVLLGLETMGKRGSWGTVQEIGEVMRKVRGVVPVVDFAHLHARSGGGLRTAEDFSAVLDEVAAIHRGRLHCHYSCVEFTEAGERRHLPLSKKQPDFALLANALEGRKMELTIISETPDPEEGATLMMGHLIRKGR